VHSNHQDTTRWGLQQSLRVSIRLSPCCHESLLWLLLRNTALHTIYAGAGPEHVDVCCRVAPFFLCS